MRDSLRLDTLRGLTCLLLVLFHVVGSEPTSGLRVADGALRTFNDALCYVRMPLFTFLSGLVYGLRPCTGDGRAFLGGKARRLLVPMLFVGTLFAILQSALPATNFGADGAGHRDWWLLHVEPVGHFWFVEALFWIFLLVWALERRQLLATPGRFALVWLAAALADVVLRGPRWLALDGALFLLPHFLAGLAVSRFGLAVRLETAWMRALCLAAAAAAIVQLGMPAPNPDRHGAWILLAGTALCALAAGTRIESPWLARIGASSYAIYLFHVFFTAGSRVALTGAGVTALSVQIAAGVAAGIAGPIQLEAWASRIAGLRTLLLGQPLQARAAPAEAA
ncbi:MAG: acyltransferase [Burkholderiales bacterium]